MTTTAIYDSTSGRLFIGGNEVMTEVRKVVLSHVDAKERAELRAMHTAALHPSDPIPATATGVAFAPKLPRPPNRAERRSAARGRPRP